MKRRLPLFSLSIAVSLFAQAAHGQDAAPASTAAAADYRQRPARDDDAPRRSLARGRSSGGAPRAARARSRGARERRQLRARDRRSPARRLPQRPLLPARPERQRAPLHQRPSADRLLQLPRRRRARDERSSPRSSSAAFVRSSRATSSVTGNFMIAGDFGATALDNPRGTNETAAAPPGAAPDRDDRHGSRPRRRPASRPRPPTCSSTTARGRSSTSRSVSSTRRS